MRYPCLILDHDDTVVKSTPFIHYPSFLKIMARLRPNEPKPTLREFMEFCSEPGYFAHCRDVIRFTDEETAIGDQMWLDYVAGHIPDLCDSFDSLLPRYREAGGIICVVTHSQAHIVERDYKAHGLPMPDLIFGAELGEGRRKPSVWPLEEISRKYGFKPREMAVVDDLMPGHRMAKSYGALAVGAGWMHISPIVRERIKASCDVYIDEAEKLNDLIF